MVFLKVYAPNEETHCAIVDWPSTDTFRKWSWYFVKRIALLQADIIVFDNRFNGQPDMNDIKFDCMISVDCLDCPCSEKYPFSTEIFQ